MKAYKTTILVAAVLMAFLGLTPKTWAGGGSVGFVCPSSVLVNNPGGGSIALRGTIAAEAHNVTFDSSPEPVATSVKNVDFILRLTRSGVTNFFRLNDPTNDYAGLTNLNIVCQLIVFLSDPDVNPNFKADLLTAFGINPNWNLFLTPSSVSNADDPDIVSGSNLSGIADVTIYAVRP